MKRQLKIMILMCILGITTSVQAQKISAEIDPATFIWKGYSMHLRIQPKETSKLLLGAGVYAMDLPKAMVNMNEKNRNNSWDVRIKNGFGLFGEYYFKDVNRKFFVGAQTSLQQYKITRENKSATHTNGLLMVYAGYSLPFFNEHWYLKPWAGIGYTSKVNGSNEVNGTVYDINPLAMFATLHIGYTF